MKRGLLVAAAIAVTCTAGGVAYATNAITSASGDTIVGCANNENGQLRIVNDASQCKANEHVVTFAAPQGPKTVTVDCTAGQSINQVLADNADSDAPLTIDVKGTC